ncbi:beta-ketoacyl-ACP synthase III [Candidatus Poribacteria bacterium]
MEKENNVGILGIGSYLPTKVLTNDDLAKIVDTNDEWIVTKTGIRERRIIAPDEATSDLAVRAAKKAIDDAGIQPDDIDLIVVATSSPDMIQPSTACLVQNAIGASNAGAFDLSAVCSGFVYAFTVSSEMMLGNPRYRYVLVIAAEAYSRILDWSDRTTCVFFGDGAGAAVLGRVEAPRGLIATHLAADGSRWDVIQMPAGGSRLPSTIDTVNSKLHSFRMKGRDIWDFAMEVFPIGIKRVLEKANMTMDEVDWVIPHQANAVMLTAAFEKVDIPLSKTHLNMDKYGNTSSASIPIALDEAIRLGKIQQGQTVLLFGFGGGMTYGNVLLRL